MTRAKQQEMTSEEQLEHAMVPAEEQPYEVPGNWVWVRVGSVCRLIGGGTPSKSNTDFWNGDIPWASVKDMKGDFLYGTQDSITRSGLHNSAANVCEIDDLLLVTRIEPGKTIVSKIRTSINQDLKIVKSKLDSRFLHWFFTNAKRDFLSQSSGSTVLGITLDIIENMALSLPPLPEQHRIVELIESLFNKLDAAKELAQSALESFETRRTAILHRAFKGELTAKWREEHGMEMDTWEEKTLDSVCSSIYDGDHMPPPKSDSGVPFLVISNVNKAVLSFDDIRYVPRDYFDKLSPTRKPQYGDVLYTIVGSYGIPAIVDIEREFCFQRHMALLKPKDILTRLLWYLLQTEEMYRQASSIATGTAQLTVPIKGLRQMTFLSPSLPEQHEIVHILDTLFDREQKARDLCDIIDKIDLIRKAILARAFRGELGTNDASDESPLEMLKGAISDKITNVDETDRFFQLPNIEEIIVMYNNIIEAMQAKGKLIPEKLKALVQLDIDDFYEQVKQGIESGKITEVREGKNVFLEAKNEN